jgi:simple sugar transport system ATP-binding protein
MVDDAIVLEAKNITKKFPGVLANDNVNFDLHKSEIHALLGENGAGKTTLMNILYGLYMPDSGEILVNGKPAVIKSPNDTIAQGIGMVHQHFMLIPVFTVAENIMLGDETVRYGMVLDQKTVSNRVRELSRQYGLEVDPDALVGQLSVGEQQRVEIVKALYRDAQILILDEPTAVLTPQEADDLFVIMRELTKRGVSIIFITHKLKEVLAVADRITAMRRGVVVGTTTPAETDEHKLATMMVGREVILTVEKKPAKPTDVVLDVEDLTILDDRDVEVVRQLSLQVCAGEILGIAGVQGNGQTELVEALTGLRKRKSGKVVLSGKEIPELKPRLNVEAGQAHIPEDRHKHGLVLAFSIADNEVLCTYYQHPFAHGMQRDQNAVFDNAVKLVERFDIRTPSPLLPARKLSGGNQQKVIVARELSRPIKLLVANQPTRGLDVGSIEYIHKQIVDMRDQGVAVLLVSAELDEILSLADRIAVMYHGQIVATMDADKAIRAELGLLMAGATPEAQGTSPGEISTQ